MIPDGGAMAFGDEREETGLQPLKLELFEGNTLVATFHDEPSAVAAAAELEAPRVRINSRAWLRIVEGRLRRDKS